MIAIDIVFFLIKESHITSNQKDDVDHGKSELALDFRVVVQLSEDEIAVRGSQYDDLVENFHSHLKLVCQWTPNEIVNDGEYRCHDLNLLLG